MFVLLNLNILYTTLIQNVTKLVVKMVLLQKKVLVQKKDTELLQ